MPVYDKTQISNMMLAHCGITGQIDDVDNEDTNEAINCRLFFDHVRGILLETREWPFALRRDPLALQGAPTVGADTTEWAYRYKYPTNCKLALRILNPAVRTPATGQKIPFKIVDLRDGYGKAILTDQADAVLEYNHDEDDVSKFSSSFVSALALGGASHIVMPLRVDPNISNQVRSQFSNWLAEASNLVSREQQEDNEPDSEFQSVRS